MPWLSRREWARHVRELSRAERRAEEAERFSRDLVNRWLTSRGSMGIEHTPTLQTAQSSAAPHRSEEVSGWSEEDFIQQLVDDGMSPADARATWKRTREFKLLPYQMEGELPS
jgi:hypothetical protein